MHSRSIAFQLLSPLSDHALLDDDDVDSPPGLFRSRRVYLKRDPKTSPWYREYILDERNRYHDVDSYNMRVYRNKFRMRRDAFDFFVQQIVENKWLEEQRPDATGRLPAPLALMILAYLALIGGGITFLFLEDVTYVSESAHRKFFAKFSFMGSTSLYKQYIKLPETNEEIAEATNRYRVYGLPGCIGSVDCTHIRLWCLRHILKHRNTGKEGFPSRSFQVIVTNDGKVISMTMGFEGATSDKTIAKFDNVLMGIKSHRLFTGDWERTDSAGATHVEHGYWLACDNGYPDWPFMVAPVSVTLSADLRRWSRMMESVRKDIECFFGRLKKRFGILLRWRFHSTDLLNEVMFTCAAIHNFILESHLDPQYTMVEIDEMYELQRRLYHPLESNVHTGVQGRRSVSRSKASVRFRHKLVEHFTYHFDNNNVFWVQ